MRLLMISVLFLVTACDGGVTDGTDSDAEYPPGTCFSDSYWTGGNRESPRMRPGGDCIQCHIDMREGPRYSVAGTVYTLLDEPEDCDGQKDVEVEITDSEGTVWATTSNAAGNFFLSTREANPVFPITAKVRIGDVEREMVTPQESGDCASCHTDEGANGATGRIVVP